ncbi:MAG: uroporphyrinogen-III C-methyltransferase [Hyphomicrobiaceae bacterium]|nr:uroporphyrinogen-III C-methyltransferase [Hyphomicrobiaceae bacterium]
MPGSVWLVGAGPGAPGLLTLLGFHALSQADVIVYDALVSEDILRWKRDGANLEFAGKRGGKPSAKQQDISLRLAELAQENKCVLRLKGGDPLTFGRGGEECETLAAAGIPFRIVPGITSGVGGLAYAGIPTTHRDTNHSVLFLTGHDATGDIPQGVDWENVANASPVVVMYMAVRNLPKIARTLIGFGRDPDEPVAVLSNATLPHQSVHTTTLGQIPETPEIVKLPTPALVVLGKVVDFHRTLDWYAKALRENAIG